MGPETEMAMDKQTTAMAFAELRGRRRWSEEEGRFVINAWEASGESVPTFAQRAGLYAQRVYWWKERLGRGDAAKSSPATSSASAFVPVTVRAEAAAPPGMLGAAVTVVVSPELRIEVADLDATSAAWVATLVQSLREVRP
jgi:transposase-like protein